MKGLEVQDVAYAQTADYTGNIAPALRVIGSGLAFMVLCVGLFKLFNATGFIEKAVYGVLTSIGAVMTGTAIATWSVKYKENYKLVYIFSTVSVFLMTLFLVFGFAYLQKRPGGHVSRALQPGVALLAIGGMTAMTPAFLYNKETVRGENIAKQLTYDYSAPDALTLPDLNKHLNTTPENANDVDPTIDTAPFALREDDINPSGLEDQHAKAISLQQSGANDAVDDLPADA